MTRKIIIFQIKQKQKSIFNIFKKNKNESKNLVKNALLNDLNSLANIVKKIFWRKKIIIKIYFVKYYIRNAV